MSCMCSNLIWYLAPYKVSQASLGITLGISTHHQKALVFTSTNNFSVEQLCLFGQERLGVSPRSLEHYFGRFPTKNVPIFWKELNSKLNKILYLARLSINVSVKLIIFRHTNLSFQRKPSMNPFSKNSWRI